MSPSTLEPVLSPVSYLTLFKSAVRSLVVQLTYDNPLIWDYTQGRRNKQADVEGPFYILDSPGREIEKGKAIMAPAAMLKKFRPFLMIVRILSPEGNPVPGAVLDWWQSDSSGSYYFSTYTLRGHITTDEEGYAEVLTVAPAVYGIASLKRAAHFHVWVHAPPAQSGQAAFDDVTTQLYVCDANDVQIMQKDFVNYARKMREGNMAQAWSLPDKDIDDGRHYKDFPELSSSDAYTRKRVEWWNSKLVLLNESGLKVAAGATLDLHLNRKTQGWF